MRVAVIENRLKDYVIDIFNRHQDTEIELINFLEWKSNQEQYQGISIGKIEELYNGQFDIILVAIKENRYLSRLLTYLHKRHIQNVYIVRLFALDMQEDFLDETQSMYLHGIKVDCMPKENEKPYLVHLETHVCDHCNLNCKACNNFSPFVKEPSYADIGQFESDLKRLAELFSGIGRFFLLGGEPLLAPELCCDMIRCYRKYFPVNELRVLTNATLILTMKDEFWDCVRENDVIIHISLYPPVKERIGEIRERLESRKVKYIVFKEVETFAKRLTLYPFEDEKFNNEHCGSAGCHYLRNGEISKCPDAMLVDFMVGGNAELKNLALNERENLMRASDGWELIEKLEEYIDLCKKCTFKRIKRTKWERIENEADAMDWLVPNRYEYEVEEARVEIKKLKDRIEALNNKVENQDKEIKVLQDRSEDKDCELKSMEDAIWAYAIREKELNEEINEWRIKCNNTSNRMNYAQQEYQRINKSFSHKIGRCITWIPRKVRRTFQKVNGSGVFKILRLFIIDILKGYTSYKSILLKYQNELVRNIYYMDYSGSGDTYLSCEYLSSIGEVDNEDIFIAPSCLAAEIAKYYNFKHIEVIENSKAFSVRRMERFCQHRIFWRPLLYESEPLIYSGVMRHMQGYKGIDFMTLLKIGYEINLDTPYTEKKWEQSLALRDDSNVDQIFKENNLEKGNTVLIAPYAGRNQLCGVSFEFYCTIAKKLKKLGFVVCTNSSNSDDDIVIPDTISIFLPHGQMIRFCEEAGFFIGIRSGLCDIISSAKMKKKIVIYPKQKTAEGVANWIDFFSLINMGLCGDAIEYEYESENEHLLIKNVIKNYLEVGNKII